jgi:hypothetical protein
MQKNQPFPLDVADLAVDSFETADLNSISPILPTTDPTAATRCFYCPPASFDARCTAY